MPADPEAYLAPPSEAPVGPAFGRLAGPLWVAIVLLTLAAVAVAGLLADRQDPTLSVPDDDVVPSVGATAEDTAPVVPDLPRVPTPGSS